MNKPQTPPKYSLQQLQEYIALTKHFTENIEQVYVTKEVIEWFDEQRTQVAKNLNIPTTKNYKAPVYMGVELVVKVDVK